jgi:ubiquinone biosynthesis protein COQ9
MTASTAEQTQADLKRRLLDAALKHVPFDGFSDAAIARAGEETGADKATLASYFPQGPLSLVEAFSDAADAEMEKRLAEMNLSAMKIRERIAAAVKARLAALKPNKEAARRAAAFLSLPPHAPLMAKLLYKTVDAMWRAAGDTSTDFNFYTKRAILAGVYSSTLLRWFSDQSEDERETDAFLSARIENVMQFEKFKAQVKEQMAKLPSLEEILRGASPPKPP